MVKTVEVMQSMDTKYMTRDYTHAHTHLCTAHTHGDNCNLSRKTDLIKQLVGKNKDLRILLQGLNLCLRGFQGNFRDYFKSPLF